MIDTKENILQTALCLFATEGFEAVSVSTIAGKLGMTKGALYKHYKNKRDIFDNIVERMYKVDSERAKEHDVPVEVFESNPDAYQNISIDKIKHFTYEQFLFWSEDEFACNFRKMLILEQYRDTEMADLYQKCLVSGPVSYTEDIFRDMIAQGILKHNDPRLLALEFYSPFYLLLSMSDIKCNKMITLKLLKEHVEQFIEKMINKEAVNEI